MVRFHVMIAVESWPLAEAFVISRGTKTHATVIVVEVGDGDGIGRGECVPYGRYGETVETVLEQLATVRLLLWQVPHPSALDARAMLQDWLPPGAARNALDCALWDLEAKRSRIAAQFLTGLGSITPLLTAYTLSLGTPEEMATKARAVARLPLLKLKLGGVGDEERLRAVRSARPDARLIVDANESWTADLLSPLLEVARQTGVELIEQPLPVGCDDALDGRSHGVAICADESLHTRDDLGKVAHRYDAINIKLDKAGGLTEALALASAARTLDLDIMVGCMVATSLAMAPAMLLARMARWVDLDGPLLLARDRPFGLIIQDGVIQPPSLDLWG